jgi:hypothetical protein
MGAPCGPEEADDPKARPNPLVSGETLLHKL